MTPAISLLGAIVVAFTLMINLSRGNPIARSLQPWRSPILLWRLWARAGRPRGIASAVVESEM